MRKEKVSVYLEPEIARALKEYAAAGRKPLSLVAEAAISSFTSPDASERQEAAIAKRLDLVNRQIDQIKRDLEVTTEALALFVRFWLQVTPQLPEHQQPAARAKGAERYAAFMKALGHRLGETGFVAEIVAEREGSSA